MIAETPRILSKEASIESAIKPSAAFPADHSLRQKFKRSISIVLAVASLLSPVSSKAEPKLASLRSSNTAENGVDSPKKLLGDMYVALRKAVSLDPSRSGALITNYVRTAFDNSKGLSLAEKLKNDEPDSYQRMMKGLGLLIGSNPKLEDELIALIRANPGAEEAKLERKTRRLVRDFSKLPHYKQSSNYGECGLSAAIHLAQLHLARKLNTRKFMLLIGGTASNNFLKGTGNSGLTFNNLDKLGVPYTAHYPAKGKKFDSRDHIKKFARQVLEGEIIDLLASGKVLGFSCGHFEETGHAIAVLDYDFKTKQFVIADSSYSKLIYKPVEYLAQIWPDSYRRGGIEQYALRYLAVEPSEVALAGSYEEGYLESVSIDLPKKCLELLELDINDKLHRGNLYKLQIDRAIPGVHWTRLSNGWEKDVDTATMEGLPALPKFLLARRVSEKEPLQTTVFIISDEKGDGLQLMIVKGFTGGFANFDGDITVVTKDGPETINGEEFIERISSVRSSYKDSRIFAWMGRFKLN